MHLFRTIVFAAALAGLLAGLLATAAQMVRVIPLIHSAETYEQAAQADDGQAHEGHMHEGDEAWMPAAGLERIGLTAVANILNAIGFALLLVAAFALRGGATWRTGLLWGVAGFLAVSLAPSIGLPPEVPGTHAAALEARQLWWWLTAASTAGGLALILLQRSAWAAVLGVALIAIPHVVGAPQPAEPGGAAPAWLAREFIVATLATSLLFWLVLGGAAGFLYGRLAGPKAA